jgi:transcriptional regulator with XRE-family HTH domain
VGDNWDAVADAIQNRIAELGITQRELVARSGVSESTIRQIQKNYGPRRRNRHTLEDLSRGLQWPGDYLGRILNETKANTHPDVRDPLWTEVAELRDQLADLASRVEALEHGHHSG